MARLEDALRRTRTRVVASERRGTSSKLVLSASARQLWESSTLLATGISALERSEARRATPRLSLLSDDVTDGTTAADVLPSLVHLREIRRRFMREHDGDALVNEVLDVAMRATRTELGNIQLFNRRSGVLEIVAHRGFECEFLDFFGRVDGEIAACGASMRERRRVIVEDVMTHPIFVGQPAQDILLRAGVQAVQCTPIITPSGELVGVISTHFRSPHRVPTYRLRLMEIISRQVAEFIQKSSLDAAS